jgi:hypothetical protein
MSEFDKLVNLAFGMIYILGIMTGALVVSWFIH